MKREYFKWHSPNLNREMELLSFGHAGKAVLFFPTRMARFYDYENWRIIEQLSDKINNGEMQVFCVDSVDAESFYNQQIHPSLRIDRHLKYEKYIIEEVLPFIKLKNGCDYCNVAGCSMGAYHAVNIAFKFPGQFKKVVAMSGRYDLTQELLDFKDLFDGYHDETIYFNMPLQYVSNLDDAQILTALRKIDVTLVIGETDPFLANNQQFSTLLHNKGLFNNLHVWNCYAHRPRYWRQMVRLYL